MGTQQTHASRKYDQRAKSVTIDYIVFLKLDRNLFENQFIENIFRVLC